MFAEERHAIILELIGQAGRVSAADLAERFSTTRETIRRDLSTLEEAGLLRRVHGGAVAFPAASSHELPLDERAGQNLAAKVRIGDAAHSLVTTGGTSVILDAGTTTLQLAAAIVRGDRSMPAASPTGPLFAVTHALPIATRLADAGEGVRLELIGGQVRTLTQGAVGHQTLQRYAELSADIAFVGANAVTAGFGLSTPDAEEAAVKHAIIRAARRVVVLADSSKFQEPALNRFAAFSDIDTLITDAAPSAALMDELAEADVDVHIV